MSEKFAEYAIELDIVMDQGQMLRCATDNWSYDVVGLMVQRIRGQHSKWMVEYGKVTVKDLIKWIP